MGSGENVYRTPFVRAWVLATAQAFILGLVITRIALYVIPPLDTALALLAVNAVLGLGVALVVRLGYRARVSDKGIEGRSTWLRHRFIAWEAIREVRPSVQNVLGWRWLSIQSTDGLSLLAPTSSRKHPGVNEYFQRNISGSIARPWPAVTLLRSVTVAAAGLGLAAGVGYGLRAAIFQARERPAAMEQARVLTAMSGLSKSVAFSDESIGRITDIRSLRRHGQGSGTLRIVGTKAAVTLDDGHEVLDIVRFAGCCTRVNGIDEALAEQGFFYDRGGWCCDPSVIDAQGQVLWTYSAAVGANDMDASDMDGDGRLDFVIGFNGDGGVHLLDADGHVAWQAPDGNVWHVEFADIDGDGRQEIVHSNADGLIVVRAQDGEVLSVAEPEAYVSDFSLVRWPSSHALESVLYAKDDAVHLLGFRGEVRAALPAPLSEILGEARAAVFHAADQDLLAVVVEYPSWDRSMIYLYDASHGLLYHEVVADRLGAVAAAPGEGGNEDLLVGGNGHMLRYRWTAVSTIAHSEIGGATQPR